MTIKVSVINFKGGVGKSTLAFHLAAHLAQSARVLVVDVDHQSSLSLIMMGAKLWDHAVKARQTCNTIFESFCNRKVSFPGAELIHRNIMQQKDGRYNYYPTLDLVPAQFELDDTEIEMASTTTGSAMVSEWHKRTLMADWLDAIDVKENYDYVIFDCPPATKLVSQNAIAASDYFVIPVIPDVMSSRGVTHFRSLVTNKIDKKLEFLRVGASISDSEVPESYCPVSKLAAIVPSMAKPAGNAASGLTNVHTEQLSSLRGRWGNDVIKTVVLNLTGVPEALDVGWPVWNIPNTPNLDRVVPMMRAACKDVAARLV